MESISRERLLGHLYPCLELLCGLRRIDRFSAFSLSRVTSHSLSRRIRLDRGSDRDRAFRSKCIPDGPWHRLLVEHGRHDAPSRLMVYVARPARLAGEALPVRFGRHVCGGRPVELGRPGRTLSAAAFFPEP